MVDVIVRVDDKHTDAVTVYQFACLRQDVAQCEIPVRENVPDALRKIIHYAGEFLLRREIFAETVSQQFLRQFGMMILDWRVLRTEISRSPILAGAEPEHYLIHKVRFAMSGNTGDGEHPPRFQPHDFVQIRYSQFHARSIPLFKQLVQPLP